MALRMTFTKNAEGTFDVKLTGGSPWGFTLQGGSEFHSKLCVSKVSSLLAQFICVCPKFYILRIKKTTQL